VGLLGHVLERVTRSTYEELVAERITRPLGMVDTSIAIPDEKRARFAQGHDRRGRPVPGWNLAALVGAGGLRSTVADLLRFLEAQLGRGPAGVVESMRATHEPRARRGSLSVGLGWFMLLVPGQPSIVVWHDGGTGGYRSVAGFVEASQTRVVVLASSARNVDRIGLEIVKSLGS
jgi:CubicO group peptidase (beta-lactamase class C family)